jgi:hypothetical protein
MKIDIFKGGPTWEAASPQQRREVIALVIAGFLVNVILFLLLVLRLL